MKNQTYKIENFVGEFDNFFSDEIINHYINFFDRMVKMGMVIKRNDVFKVTDTSVLINQPNPKLTQVEEVNMIYHTAAMNDIFWKNIYTAYVDKFEMLNHHERFSIQDIKIQKTSPGEGYHTWHNESSNQFNANRMLAFIFYLNDVEEGGETEFLYLNKRIKPVRNKFILFPGYFTHTHRGNPPLTGDKYIITGWISYGIQGGGG